MGIGCGPLHLAAELEDSRSLLKVLAGVGVEIIDEIA